MGVKILCGTGYRRRSHRSIAAEVEKLKVVPWKLAVEQLYIGQPSTGRLILPTCFLKRKQVCLQQAYTQS